MYNQRQEKMRKMRYDQMCDYQQTTGKHMGVAQANQLQRDETESQIKKLEEAEMQMLSQMQATLKRKQEAMG